MFSTFKKTTKVDKQQAENQLENFNAKAVKFYMTLHSVLHTYKEFQILFNKNLSHATIAQIIELANKNPTNEAYQKSKNGLIFKITNLFNTAGYNQLTNEYAELINSYEKLCGFSYEDEKMEHNKSLLNYKELLEGINGERNKYFTGELLKFEEEKTPKGRFKLCQDTYNSLYKIVSEQKLDELAKQIEFSVNKNPDVKVNSSDKSETNKKSSKK